MEINLSTALIIAAGLLALGMVAIAGSVAKLATAITSGMTILQRMLSGVLATASQILLTRRGGKDGT